MTQLNEQDFRHFYENELEPRLMPLRALNEKRKQKQNMAYAVIAGFYLLFVTVTFMAFKPLILQSFDSLEKLFSSAFVLSVTTLFYFVFFAKPFLRQNCAPLDYRYDTEYEMEVIAPVVELCGEKLEYDPKHFIDADLIRDSALLYSYHYLGGCQYIKGEWEGRKIELSCVCLDRGEGWLKQRFVGSFISTQSPISVYGRLAIFSKNMPKLSLKELGFEPINLSPELSHESFEVYSNYPEEASSILNERLASSIRRMSESCDFALCLVEDRLYLILPEFVNIYDELNFKKVQETYLQILGLLKSSKIFDM